MAKIAMTTTKYVILVKLDANGVVENSDVVGAIFGQTEGLLGEDLELRELQRTGRIGRIEVEIKSRGGKSSGTIQIPTSLSKEETALIAASVETIDRIGPCEAKMKIEKVQDVREAKRKHIVDEAKRILRDMIDSNLPDSIQISESIKTGVRENEITTFGPDKLPAGPDIDKSDEIIIVEGRADVINLLRAGIKNVISLEGTSVPKTISELSKKKTCIAFLDGDRGGDLILKELGQVAKIDSVARAPDGKEVEELAQKDVLKCLRGKASLTDAAKAKTAPTSAPRPRSAPSTTPQVRGRTSTADRSTRSTRSDSGPSRPAQRSDSGPSRPAQRSDSGPSRPAQRSDSGPSRPAQRSGPRPDRRGGFRDDRRPDRRGGFRDDRRPDRRGGFRDDRRPYDRPSPVQLDASAKTKYKTKLDTLAGSEEAELLNNFSSVGRVPTRDLAKVLNNMGNTKLDSIVIDGEITQDTVDAAATKNVKLIIGTHRAFKKRPNGLDVITQRDL